MKIDLVSRQTVDSVSLLVKPAINPVLSDYIKALTGISQDDLDTVGIPFQDAFDLLDRLCAAEAVWVYGRTDLEVLNENLILNHMPTGLVERWKVLDIAPHYRAVGIDTNSTYTSDLARLLGVDLSGAAHNALADAQSLAQASLMLVDRGLIAV